VIIRVCLAAALLTPAAAMAQGNPGPYGKLFGRAPASSAGEEHTTVEVRASIGASYDDALLAPEGSPADTPSQSGVSGDGSMFVSLDHRSSVFVVNLSGGGGRGEYFTQPSSYGTNQYFANALVSAKLTTRFEAQATAGYTHSPAYQFFSGFGHGPIPQGNDNAVNPDYAELPFNAYASQMLENDNLVATASLIARITEKSSLDLSVTHNQTKFAQQPDSDITIRGYRGTWRWPFRRDLGVHASYGQDHVDLRAPDRLDYDSTLIDVGVDFNRAFSVARRTTLGFNTSTGLVKQHGFEGEFRINGGVSLAKSFRRTWHASVQLTRATSFIPGFTEPLYSDTFTAGLGGMFSRRIDFSVMASASRGQSVFSDASGFATYTGTSQLSFALGRHISAYGSYFTYWYEVPPDAFTLTVPGTMARQVVSAGLRFYLPVYNKERRGL
jgi:hypothetical protein